MSSLHIGGGYDMTSIFASLNPPTLQGGRQKDTGEFIFPLPETVHDNIEIVPLERTGTVWSYTVQRFPPKSPPYNHGEEFTPYIVAYVSLADQLMIETRLIDVAIEEVEIGMQVELTLMDFKRLNDGETEQIHAFRPLKEAGR